MATVEIDRYERNAATRRRYERLRRAGYEWGSALRLASSPEVDVRLAERLLRAGCESETALRILL